MRSALIGILVILDATSATLATAGEPPEGVEERAAMPPPGGEPTLRLDLQPSRTVWGEWERVRFDFRVVNATRRPIRFEDGDAGRGLAGKLLYLRDARGKVPEFGAHWAAPPHYRPNFTGRRKAFDPGAATDRP